MNYKSNKYLTNDLQTNNLTNKYLLLEISLMICICISVPYVIFNNLTKK